MLDKKLLGKITCNFQIHFWKGCIMSNNLFLGVWENKVKKLRSIWSLRMYSIKKYLLSNCYGLVTILDAGEKIQMTYNLCPQGAQNLVKKTSKQKITFNV